MMNAQLVRDMFSEALNELLDGAPIIISLYAEDKSIHINVSRETLETDDEGE